MCSTQNFSIFSTTLLNIYICMILKLFFLYFFFLKLVFTVSKGIPFHVATNIECYLHNVNTWDSIADSAFRKALSRFSGDRSCKSTQKEKIIHSIYLFMVIVIIEKNFSVSQNIISHLFPQQFVFLFPQQFNNIKLTHNS